MESIACLQMMDEDWKQYAAEIQKTTIQSFETQSKSSADPSVFLSSCTSYNLHMPAHSAIHDRNKQVTKKAIMDTPSVARFSLHDSSRYNLHAHALQLPLLILKCNKNVIQKPLYNCTVYNNIGMFAA